MIINWGDAPFKAFVTVTYDRGTCTVSLDGKTYTHTGGGTHTFAVNKKGSWTVKASDGTSTRTKTAVITERNQSVSISLIVRLELINGGTVETAKSGGISKMALATNTYESSKTSTSISKGSTSVTLTGGDSNSSSGKTSAAIFYSAKAIDLTDFDYIQFTGSFTVTDRSGSWVGFGVLSATPTTGSCNFAAQQKLTASASSTYKIDITSLKGSYHIGYLRNYRPGSATLTSVVLF